LPAAVCDRKRPIEVTRAAGGSAIDLDAQIERVLPMHAVEEVTHTSTVYRRELGQHDRATAGPTTRSAVSVPPGSPCCSCRLEPATPAVWGPRATATSSR
jgi:hypothetical protein